MSTPTPLPPFKEHSNSEMMREWLNRQPLWVRWRYSWRHAAIPPWAAWATKIGFGGISLAAVAGFGYYVIVHRFTASPDFTRLMEQEAGEYLGLAVPTLSQAQWQAGSVALTDLSGQGNSSSYIRSFKLGAARFNCSFSQLFDEKWSTDILLLQGLEVELRGGLLEANEAARITMAQEEQQTSRRTKLGLTGEVTGKYGVNPSSTSFSFKRFIARSSSIRWGLNERSAGEISKTTIEGTRLENGSWRVNCTGGEFSQGWIENAVVDELSFAADKDGITITKFDFRLPLGEGKQGQDGIGHCQGKITFGEKPVVDLEVTLREVEVNRLLPEAFHRIFAGYLEGKATMKGSIGDEDGLTSHFDLKFQNGFGFGVGSRDVFPVLEVLGGEAADLPVRYIAAARGGITMDIAGKTAKASGVKIESEEGERIEGFFTLDTSANNISGVFRVGLIPSVFEDHPRVAENFFREESAGLRWLSIPMEGAIGTSTISIAEGLRASLKQQVEDRKNKR